MAVPGVTVISQQGDLVDLIVWRHYGKTSGRRVEIVLDHSNNYSLPDRDEILPIGTRVYLPEIIEPLVIPTFKLWG